MTKIINRLLNSSPNESSHELYCRCLDAAEELQKTDAIDELAEIHKIVMCIACVTGVDESDTYTVRAVKEMAMRINRLEALGLSVSGEGCDDFQ